MADTLLTLKSWSSEKEREEDIAEGEELEDEDGEDSTGKVSKHALKKKNDAFKIVPSRCQSLFREKS